MTNIIDTKTLSKSHITKRNQIIIIIIKLVGLFISIIIN